MGVALKDVPTGGTEWAWGQPQSDPSNPSVLDLAKLTLNVHASSPSDSSNSDSYEARRQKLATLGASALQQLQYARQAPTPRGNPLGQRALHGRQFADAAFLFAVAGVPGPEALFEALADGTHDELRRWASYSFPFFDLNRK